VFFANAAMNTNHRVGDKYFAGNDDGVAYEFEQVRIYKGNVYK